MSTKADSATISDRKSAPSHASHSVSHSKAGVQTCQRCVLDSTVPGVRFDAEGICNHCKFHDTMNRLCPVGAEGEKILQGLAAKIRASGKGRPYDCIVGLSGGRDTCYCLYKTKELGLRPLAVHFDNGWDSDIAKNNIRKVCTKLDVDLHSVIADWEESRELTNCTIRASLPYIDLTDDIGIASALYRTAAQENIHWIIHSHSYRTEGIVPLKWNYFDGRFTRSLIEQFCRIPLKHFKNTELRHFLYWVFIKRIRVLTITNYYNDSDPKIDDFLKSEFGWEDTGGWHFDNEIFGLQCHYARVKFGIDWRITEYAALVREQVMSREEALAKLKEIPPIERKEVVDYALKKQGISPEEWEQILAAPLKYFTDYPSYYPLLKAMKIPLKVLGRLNILPLYTYEKYFELV